MFCPGAGNLTTLTKFLEGQPGGCCCLELTVALLSSENTKHKGKEYFCNNCLQGFNEKSSRDEHMGYCIDNESVKVEMPN